MTEQSSTSTQLVKSEGFSAIETRQNAETSAMAMAAKVRANIEAACIMAERHPRNMLDLRSRLLEECRRPGFCKAARYRLPRKKWNPETRRHEPADIVGFSIRFAEAAFRYYRNVESSSEVVYEDDEKMLVTVTVRDYETNLASSDTIKIPKRVEKKRLREGEKPIGTRLNSYGDTVFILPATDDEIAQKKGALVSKSKRTLILGLIPGDIQEECEQLIEDTNANEFARDPLAEIKRVMDAFAKIRVMPEQIATYLGHDPSTINAKELSDLRGVFQAISDGDLTWTDAVDAKHADEDSSGDEKATARNASVEEALAKAQAKLDAKRNGKQQSPRQREPSPDDDGR